MESDFQTWNSDTMAMESEWPGSDSKGLSRISKSDTWIPLLSKTMEFKIWKVKRVLRLSLLESFLVKTTENLARNSSLGLEIYNISITKKDHKQINWNTTSNKKKKRFQILVATINPGRDKWFLLSNWLVFILFFFCLFKDLACGLFLFVYILAKHRCQTCLT